MTARADAMLASLPAYYADPLILRIVQAQANEIDRLDAVVTQLETELQPGAATDALGLLAIWEQQVDLPARPPGATVAQRQGKVSAALRALGASSSTDSLGVLEAAVGSGMFVVLRNTPGELQDTLAIQALAGTQTAGIVEAIARRIWPAHRALFLRYSDGFLLELSRLDVDSF